MSVNASWPASPEPPYTVKILKGVLTDPARQNREVPWKLYYPESGDGPFPIILWSHGLGGSRDGAAFLSRHIAGHGYIVLNIQHVGTDTSLWEGKPGHPWDVIRATKLTPEHTLSRFGDVPFVLDHLKTVESENPELQGLMNLNALGMSGHSYGAMTTQAMTGMRYGPEYVSFKEPRFKAAIAYSPSPSRDLEADKTRLYGDITLPMFFMTGTEDDSPVANFGYERRVEIYENAGSTDKNLLVLNGGDHMVFSGSRGKLGKNPNRARHEEIIKTASLAFWDIYLKNDQNAKDWLETGGLSAYVAEDAKVQ